MFLPLEATLDSYWTLYPRSLVYVLDPYRRFFKNIELVNKWWFREVLWENIDEVEKNTNERKSESFNILTKYLRKMSAFLKIKNTGSTLKWTSKEYWEMEKKRLSYKFWPLTTIRKFSLLNSFITNLDRQYESVDQRIRVQM